MSKDSIASLLTGVSAGETLDEEASFLVFEAIMAGKVSDPDLAGLLLAMARREPSIDEIVGAARAMRNAMKTIESNPYAIDLCGTGGDGIGTLNISTACAVVVAACGVPVAKHGNRNMSSKSGTADCLEALGVNIELSAEGASRCLGEAGLCFLFAQTYHPALKLVAPVRRQLGVRTIFNLLGPLCNPARVRRQLVGVYADAWTKPIAEVLGRLGGSSAWVVHGDGMDELTVCGPSQVATLAAGRISQSEVLPEEAGVGRWPLQALSGRDCSYNAQALMRLLAGESGAYRDIVLINSAAALIVGGKAKTLLEGARLAGDAIDAGAARATLDKLIAVSQVAT